MKFQELLDELNIPYKTEGDKHCTPGFLNVKCPYCNGDFHLGYNLEKNYFNCWSCGSKRTLDVLQILTDKSYQECKTLLDHVEYTYTKEKSLRGKVSLPNNLGPLQYGHCNYLLERNLNPIKICELWKIQGIGISSTLQWRLFIPIIYHGETVSWTTRSISNEVNNRYISAPPSSEKLEHKKLLYGEDFVRNALIIVEGVFDVWKIGPGAVAVFGTAYSKKQILRMVKYPVRVVLFDHDAQRKAHQLVNQLNVYPGETYNINLDSKDPGEASKHDIKLLRKLYLD